MGTIFLIATDTIGRHRADVESIDLAAFWKAFQVDPLGVQRDFLVRHAGRVVSLDEAATETGFRPVAASHIPDTVAVESNYLLDLPCCRCIETVCRRDDDTLVVVFQHDDEQPDWFPDCPQVTMRIAGTTCRLIELEDHVAASCRIGESAVTIVGLLDIDELTQWVQALTGAKPVVPHAGPE